MSTGNSQRQGQPSAGHGFNELSPADCSPDALVLAYEEVRGQTTALTCALSEEDQNLQSMPEASPAKWHQAHTTWFFETFLLARHEPGFSWHDEAWCYLFNSYYNGIGRQFPRARRGLVSRPGLDAVRAYRTAVDQRMKTLISGMSPRQLKDVAALIVLGLNHEQQHQELLLTDIKHAFSFNPVCPAICEAPGSGQRPRELTWQRYDGGMCGIGFNGEGFAFDNERPVHRFVLHDYELARRPVSCAEYLAFMEDGGYEDPMLWLADGWAWVQEARCRAPLYWQLREDRWHLYTLGGLRPIDPSEPVCHVNFYEAQAFASWAGARLPTEQEWENAARSEARNSAGEHFAHSGRYHPLGRTAAHDGSDFFGNVWEWTTSAYAPYPGFQPAAGAVGEYNGKFMANQMVLRGGSCATPAGHIRPSYRNFFYPADQWQFSGLRLARDPA